MKKAGIICNMAWDRCFNLKQYYYAIKFLYKGVKLVTVCEDLDGLDILFVGDDHHYAHKEILTQPGFVDRCNANGIEVVVLTAERIFDSFFPWNVDNFKFVKRFDKLHHYTMDADDCELLGTKLHRPLFSKHFKDFIKVDIDDKLDRIVFIGNTEAECYKERNAVLDEMGKVITFDVILPTIDLWEDYMETLAKYRFVFYPIGNGNFLAFRFYEILFAKAIPICQVRKNTLKYYDIEAKFDDCIFFQEVSELPEKIQNCTLKHSYNELWSEDYLGKILKEDNLL